MKRRVASYLLVVLVNAFTFFAGFGNTQGSWTRTTTHGLLYIIGTLSQDEEEKGIRPE